MGHRPRIALVLAAILIVPALRAQSPAFDVVSIKPHQPGGPGPAALESISTMTYRDGRMTAANVTAEGLVAYAFRADGRNLMPSQIVGGPAWTTSSRFDVVATANSEMNKQEFTQLPAALRAVLEDRFKLATHTETRALPVYVLVKARSDGRLGPQIHESTVDCEAHDRDVQQQLRNAPAALIAATVGSTDRPVCGTRQLRGGGLTAGAITMRSLAGSLGLDRIALDQTGLSGRFDVDLQWSNAVSASPGDPATGTAPLSDAPSVFTALQEQLGLKLESRLEPLDVIVIEHIEPPTRN